MMNKRKFADIMRGQFQVWKGTDNSRTILEDTVRAIGFHGFGLKGDELNKFTVKCLMPKEEETLVKLHKVKS